MHREVHWLRKQQEKSKWSWDNSCKIRKYFNREQCIICGCMHVRGEATERGWRVDHTRERRLEGLVSH